MKKDRDHEPWKHIRPQMGWTWWALFWAERNCGAAYLHFRNVGCLAMATTLPW